MSILDLMMMSKRADGVCVCERCGHTWKQRGVMSPLQCPRCKNPKWNVARGQVFTGEPVGPKVEKQKPATGAVVSDQVDEDGYDYSDEYRQ